MANINEIPNLASELVDLSKTYLQEQTIAPAKRLGRVAGISLAGGVLLAAGFLLLAIAGVRVVVDLLPDGRAWMALGFAIGTVVAGGIGALIIWRASR